MSESKPAQAPTDDSRRAEGAQGTRVDDAEGSGDVPSPEEKADVGAQLDAVEIRDLLRSALQSPAGPMAPRILGGVQTKLRRRSRGKFYGDGWSIAKSPRSTYLVTSILMLVLLTLIYFVLIPWGGPH
jgi:hypothetical protein